MMNTRRHLREVVERGCELVRRSTGIKPWLGLAGLLGVVACASPGATAPVGPGPGAGVDPGPGPDPGTDPGTGPQPAQLIEVVVDGLSPGWLVTTSHIINGAPRTDTTQVSDGSPMTFNGTSDDVFIATVTDGNGALMSTQTMKSPCTLARSHQLRVPGEFATIQAAIDAAHPGDTVAVAPGTYAESVVMRAGVCLLGSGARHTVLDAGGEPRSLVDLSDAPGSVVAGFTLRGVTMPSGCANTDPFTCSGDWYSAGIFVSGEGVGARGLAGLPVATRPWRSLTEDAPALILDNVFEHNDIGVMLNFHGVAIVRNNVFVANRSGLVANHFQSHTLVADNVFLANTELAVGNDAAYLDLIENVISGSQLGVRFAAIQTGSIRCNVFFHNGANANEPRFTIGSDGNIEVDPRFVDPDRRDFHLQPGSPAIDAGCHGDTYEPDGTPHDIGAYAGPLAAWAEL
jgi:hypothetical protein